MANYNYITLANTRIRVSRRAALRWENYQKLVDYVNDAHKRISIALEKGNGKKAANIREHLLVNTRPQVVTAAKNFVEVLTDAESEKFFELFFNSDLIDLHTDVWQWLNVYELPERDDD